jgi:hypothetical protein
MIRFLFRFVGLLALALAFVLLVYDGTKSIADQTLYISSVDYIWSSIHEGSRAQVQPTLERLAPWLWDPVGVAVLNAPTELVLGIFGAILILIGRKRRPLIGYARD